MIHTLVSVVDIQKINGRNMRNAQDALAVEEPLEIRLLYSASGKRVEKNISVTMRTPGNDQELALGFLFTEGILQRIEQIQSVRCTMENLVSVELRDGADPVLPLSDRNFFTTSSCGICGKASIDAIATKSLFKGMTLPVTLRADVLYKLPAILREHQEGFAKTGGLHASALFSGDGDLQILKEDVGRHNALDKIIGTAFQQQLLPLHNSVLLLSGRASFELIQKAVMAGIKIVVAIGAPSTLAVQGAKENDVTLVGFLREQSFNIYSGTSRIVF